MNPPASRAGVSSPASEADPDMSAEDHAPSLGGVDWLERPEARAVFAALASGGHGARAVGGVVRDALLGRPVKDVDLATTALPEVVLQLAKASGLKAVPTGLAHGTVTIVSGGVPYEVTTLRRDIETFGRRARVTFTTDWAEDARRRDFTMNALYCGSDGAVFDPLRGYPDLAAGRVRFIGDGRQRIREDYLRILRFFRFSADYAQGELDPAGLAACAFERHGLGKLSGERVRAELLRLLAAPRAVDVVAAMMEYRILDFLFPRHGLQSFTRLAGIERSLGRHPDPLLRLAALAPGETADADRIAERLRLSNAEAQKLAHAMARWPDFDPATPERSAKIRLYLVGPAAYADGALIEWARSDDSIDNAERRDRVTLPERWQVPAHPFRGADVVALGVPPGPRVRRVLDDFEAWWIAEGFPTEGEPLRSKLAEIAARC